jgi:sn-glycerol 3-phosphate transport system permease protein
LAPAPSLIGNIVMSTTILALIPPVLVIILMQKSFVKGLTDTEK